MTTSAIRRFVDMIGAEHLDHGAYMSERSIGTGRLHVPFLNGKEDFILTSIYANRVGINPYLRDSDLYHAFRSGAGIERADLQDVVKRCRT